MKAYLNNVKKLFEYYKLLGEKSIGRLTAEQLLYYPNENTNSIAVIVKHMRGNMLSRWTDFLTSDGEKPWRSRDDEFNEEVLTKEDVLRLWNEGWTSFKNALASITENDLDKIIFIRNEGLTVLDAINRQLAHYSYHVGQIVFMSKQSSDHEWESLSIPKNNSSAFNKEKFANEKEIKSFTDAQIKKL